MFIKSAPEILLYDQYNDNKVSESAGQDTRGRTTLINGASFKRAMKAETEPQEFAVPAEYPMLIIRQSQFRRCATEHRSRTRSKQNHKLQANTRNFQPQPTVKLNL